MKEAAPKVWRVVIVGGGTSGYLTASIMSMHLNRLGVQVSIVESPDVEPIGVGEATIPSIHRLLDNLKLTETDFMRRCSATYKLGIQFKDWHRPDHEYWHPFGHCGSLINQKEAFPYWLAHAKRGKNVRPFQSYSLHWNAALAGRSPISLTSDSPIVLTKSYAYHLDANAFSEVLKAIAVANGTAVFSGTVVDIVTSPQGGNVAAVVLADGSQIEGDLFIDCTGFRSVLMTQLLEQPFRGWDSSLLCDRAVSCNLSSRPEVAAFTSSVALSSGWAWFLPLATRVGCGYVYGKSYLDESDAEKELLVCAQREGYSFTEGEQTFRHLCMRVGRMENSWCKNVVAIGPSACFIEPLESTAIHLTQTAVELLMELFPCAKSFALCRDRFNDRMNRIYDQTKDFIQLHYLLSQRTGTAFWRDSRAAPPSEELRTLLNGYDACAWLEGLLPESFPATSYHFLLYGNRRLPNRAPVTCQACGDEDLRNLFAAIVTQNENELRKLAFSEDMLSWIHHSSPAR